MASYKRQSLSDKSVNAHLPDKHNSISTPDSNISNRPVVASSTADSIHLTVKPPSTSNVQNTTTFQKDNISMKNISSSVHDMFQTYSDLSERYNTIYKDNSNNKNNNGENNSFPVRKQHKRQPSAPPVLYNSPELSHTYDTFTQSSEPINTMQKSNEWHDTLLDDLKGSEYQCQGKSEHVDENRSMKLVDSHKFNNIKSPSMEYISSLSGSKPNQKVGGKYYFHTSCLLSAKFYVFCFLPQKSFSTFKCSLFILLFIVVETALLNIY